MWPKLTDEQRLFQATVRQFAKSDVEPLAAILDRDQEFPRAAWERAADLGLLGVTADPDHGGAGQGVTELCIVSEELAAACMSTCVTVIHQADLVVDTLARNATAEQRARLLPGLCDGSTIGCLAITEPEAGSDAMSMTTTARRSGADFILSGQKTFITNGPAADLALVYAKLDGSDRGAIDLFAVETGSDGFSRGPKLEKMGWRGSPTGELVLEDVVVPADALIGEPGSGLDILMSGLNSERLVMAAQAIGLAQCALDEAVAYARERRQFGRPIADFQLIRAKLATIYSEIQACRALTYTAAAAADDGQVGDITRQASAAKLLATEMAMRATTEAVQVLGGYGYTKDYPVERLMRDAKILTIGGGTSEIQLHIIGKSLAGGGPTR